MPSLEKPKSVSRRFLILAQQHLKLAESAYEQENFSDTISLLAQSVELSSKSFLSNFGIISENDFKEIGHVPSKGFEKSIDKIDIGYENIHKNLNQIEFKEVEEIPEFDIQTIQQDKSRFKSLLSTIAKKPHNVRISKKNMETLLLTIQNLQSQLEISRNKIFSDPEYLQNCKDFQKDVFTILNNQKMEKRQIEMLKYASIMFYEILGDTLNIKDKAIVLHNVVNVTITTNILSIITQPHAIPSRYNVYKKTDLLVQNFPLINKELQNSLDDLETIFEISERNPHSKNLH